MTLEQLCYNLAHIVNKEESWNLSNESIQELTRAILPHVKTSVSNEADKEIIKRIIVNYNKYNGTVEALLKFHGLVEQDTLVKEYYAYIKKVIIKYRKSSIQNVDDLMNEIWIKIIEGLPQYHYHSKLESYFYTIIINACAEWYKTESKHKRLITGLHPLPEDDEDRQTLSESIQDTSSKVPEEVTENSDLLTLVKRKIKEAVETMRDKTLIPKEKKLKIAEDRILPEIFDEFKDKSYEEIKEETGVNVDTAATIVKRIKEILKTYREIQSTSPFGCRECQAELQKYASLGERKAKEKYPLVWNHLKNCRYCRDTLDELRE